MIKFLKSLLAQDGGTVTVDWVVLTAALIGMAIAAYTAIDTSADGLVSSATSSMSVERH